ncbi:MAG: porphobilinogen synthase [Rickettsiales bacterium]
MTSSSTFPYTRLRRTRMNVWSRELVAESKLLPADLILPVFIEDGKNTSTPIPSLPDVNRVTTNLLVKAARDAYACGIKAIALFPKIAGELKSPYGDQAFFDDNLVCRAIKELKNAVPDIGVIADVALDPYTTHGQDGIMVNGRIDNDATIEALCKQALNMARAGCDVLAPSDMMDGRIGAIREVLEEEGFIDTIILSYSAKYASSMYAPFRDAVGSGVNLGKSDKRTYQMDYANSDEAMREIEMDIAEGADIVMVKPAIAYLDIIQRASSSFNIPVFAYQVSGEYAMIKAAAANGWIDGEPVMLEQLTSIKRAGAKAIFTYAALDVAIKL